MINLHGCAQKAEDLKKDGNWEITADEYNMLVALPAEVTLKLIASLTMKEFADSLLKRKIDKI